VTPQIYVASQIVGIGTTRKNPWTNVSFDHKEDFEIRRHGPLRKYPTLNPSRH